MELELPFAVAVLGLPEEATTAGARLSRACKAVGLTERTVQRWVAQGGGDDLHRLDGG